MKLTNIKLNSYGYVKLYESGLTIISSISSYDNDEEIQEFLLNGGIIEPEFTDIELLDQAKAAKLIIIENDYLAADKIPTDYKGTQFNGGVESAVNIDRYVRLNRINNSITYYIWDINNIDIQLSDTEANALIYMIGNAATVNLRNRKDRKLALKKVDLEALADDGTKLYPTLEDALRAVESI